MPITRSFLSFVILTAGFLSELRGSSAEITANIKCVDSYSWAYNSHKQSPCLVAAYLQSVCTAGDFAVDPLPRDTHYTGPAASEANLCDCNTVVYSLISACGDCQNRTYISWKGYSMNCSTTYPRIFPADIPPATSVPAWAYLDVEASDIYSPELAKAASNTPESTIGNDPSPTPV